MLTSTFKVGLYCPPCFLVVTSEQTKQQRRQRKRGEHTVWRVGGTGSTAPLLVKYWCSTIVLTYHPLFPICHVLSTISYNIYLYHVNIVPLSHSWPTVAGPPTLHTLSSPWKKGTLQLQGFQLSRLKSSSIIHNIVIHLEI